MKSKSYYMHPATFLFLLTGLVYLASWVGSMQMGSVVQNLLTSDAFRWQLRNALPAYTETPALGVVMILFIGGGLLIYSGWFAACRKLVVARDSITRKERMGLFFSLVVGVVYLLLLFSVTIAPFTILQSVTGSLSHSPFSEGIYYLASIGMGLMALFFGYTSGSIYSDRDVFQGMTFLFIHCADYFVILFFLVQLFLVLEYSCLLKLIGIDNESLDVIFLFLSNLSLLFLFYEKNIFGKKEL
ncbi:MAG: AbgT family transporter [Phocaeicola sp.]